MIIPCVCSFSTFFAFVLQTPCSSVNRQYSRTAGLLQRRPRVGGGLASPSARHARRHRSGHQGGAAPLARYFWPERRRKLKEKTWDVWPTYRGHGDRILYIGQQGGMSAKLSIFSLFWFWPLFLLVPSLTIQLLIIKN